MPHAAEGGKRKERQAKVNRKSRIQLTEKKKTFFQKHDPRRQKNKVLLHTHTHAHTRIADTIF